MIEAIREIGEYSLEKMGRSVENPFDILVDDPTGRDTKNVLFIVLEGKKEDDEFTYKGVEFEEYSNEKLNKYAYKKGSSNSLDATPTSMVTSIDSTFERVKILPWFKNHRNFTDDEDENFLVKIGNSLRENKEKISSDLKDKSSKESNVISLKIDNRYVGDYDIFCRLLVESSTKRFYFLDGTTSKSENKICSVCNQKKAEVYGFVGTYKFYTVDKIGFVSGGFHKKDAWKNYPVCLDCALKLEAGKKYMGENMNFNFYGFKYLLIPKFLVGIDEKVKKEIFGIFENQRDPKFQRENIKQLTSDENEVFELMSEQENYLNLDFMFYDAPKGYNGTVFNILLYVEDVFPSRLRRLFKVKETVDDIDIFKKHMIPVFENKKKIAEQPLKFSFGILRTFFPKVSNNRTYNKYFLDIAGKIFKGKPVSYSFLVNFIIRKIRGAFINPEKWFGSKNQEVKTSTLKGFMLLNYLNVLGILKQKGMREFMGEEKNKEASNASLEITQRIDSFFEKFGNFFDGNAKKAIFLEGILAQLLLKIQYNERGATPFRVKLKGLKLDERQIKKLLPEIQNKLEEYGKNYYQSLESIISKYFIMAGNNWELSNDEISFYFVLGMNLFDMFKTEKEENGGGEEDE